MIRADGSSAKWAAYVTLGSTVAIGAIGWLVQGIPGSIKIIATVLLLASAGGQVVALRKQDREKQRSKYSGVLRGPCVTALSAQQEVYPKLKLGMSNVFIQGQGPQYKLLLDFLEDNQLVIWTKNEELKLSTKIRHSDGNLIAEIVANEWKLKKESLWDRNYSKNALEVKNGAGDVVLQVLMKGDCIQFAAKMYSSNGEGLAMGSRRFTDEDMASHRARKSAIVAAKDGPKEVNLGDMTGVLERIRPGTLADLTIEPIFKYPSDLHLGEFLQQIRDK